MGKHSLQRESRLPNSVKGALVMGAVAATGAMPAVPAMAATINIPGIGGFDVPVPQEFEQPVQQLNQQLQQALAAPQTGAPQQAPLAAPQFPNFQMPNPFEVQSSPGDIALDAAKTKVGAMYSWGAAGPSSFDCSGLVKWAYRQAGIELPRTSFEQSHVGAPVAFQDLQPGDIVVTNGGGHVGLYAGDGKLLNAVQSGQPVSYTPLRPDMVVTARRIVD
ncbi:Cell wall-associated hydrolase, NlpC family [Nocardia amikacinitolerans]|uniref:C40 family peptidase n=1 Tax=Nocardia amikacinitolerans TaxID=756689 RepID=UPI0020A4E307|nr:NlpC/P60 family protein [Nocardia amikacinitolerans]MCP2294974.1 Cell wall-associated hydrolase, NlpC family [Nocardia amikacinitolerans]